MFLAGRSLIGRQEVALKEEGKRLLQEAAKGRGEPAPVNHTDMDMGGFFEGVPVPYSPLARMVLSLSTTSPKKDQKTIVPDRDAYLAPNYVAALALMDLAQADPTQANQLLAQAEELLDPEEVFVKLVHLPQAEFLIYSLRQLEEAYWLQGNVEGARRVFENSVELLDEYEAQYQKMLGQGRQWLEQMDPDSTTAQWLSPEPHKGSLIDNKGNQWPTGFEFQRKAAREMAEAFRQGKLPQSFDSVGYRLDFRLRETLHHRERGTEDAKTIDEKLQNILGEIEDDVLFRKGHLSMAQLLQFMSRFNRHGDLGPHFQKLAAIVAKKLALQRGEVGKLEQQATKDRLKRTINPLMQIESLRGQARGEGGHDRVRAMINYGLEESGRAIREVRDELTRGDPDKNLWNGVQAYFASVHQSDLEHGAKEEILLDLVQRLLPNHAQDWAQLFDSFPETFQGLLQILKDHDYPQVEAYLVKRAAGVVNELMVQADKPGSNASILLALTSLLRFIGHKNPELLHPDHIDQLLQLDDSLDYRLRLVELFGQRVHHALNSFGKNRIEGFQYRIGEVLTGNYDPTRAYQDLGTIFQRLLQEKREPSEDLEELFRTYQEILRQVVLKKVGTEFDEKAFGDFNDRLIDQLLEKISQGPNPLAQALLEKILSSQDITEAQGKKPTYQRLLESKDLPPEVESQVIAGMAKAGIVNDYVYNRYITEIAGAPAEERTQFRQLIARLASYDAIPNGRVEDYFLVTLMEDPTKMEGFFTAYDHWVQCQKEGKGWEGDPRNPMDLAIFYYKELPKIPMSKKLSPEEFPKHFSGALGLTKLLGYLPMREVEARFGTWGWESRVHETAFQRSLREFQTNHQTVVEQIQIRGLHLPAALIELPSVVQFVALEYLQSLPLGVREDIIADFYDTSLTPEQAFKRMFEKTGNEKLGQFLSLLKGALPERFREVLKDFRGDVQGSRRDEIEAAFKQAWGVKPEEVFESFDYQMKQAGSIGEVYRGVLPAGAEVRYVNAEGVEVTETLTQAKQVAVKILTSVRQKRLEDNLKILKEVAEKLQKNANRFGLRFDPMAVYQDFARTLGEELNFKNEADNAARFSAILPEGLRMSRYFTNLSGSNIVVTEWVEGKPLDQVSDPEVRQEIFDQISNMTASHILEEGLYYEDPHPQNILVDETGQAHLIDFGRLGELREKQRGNLVGFLGAVTQGDPEATFEALRSLTTLGVRPMEPLLRSEVEGILKEEAEGFTNLLDRVDRLFKAAFETGFYVRPEYTQMLKAFMTLEGVAEEDPSLAKFEIAKYLAEPFARAYQAHQETVKEKSGGPEKLGAVAVPVMGMEQGMQQFVGSDLHQGLVNFANWFGISADTVNDVVAMVPQMGFNLSFGLMAMVAGVLSVTSLAAGKKKKKGPQPLLDDLDFPPSSRSRGRTSRGSELWKYFK